MAEVLPPFMPSSSTITMLHSRPSSSEAFQEAAPQQSPRLSQTPRSMYTGQGATTSYRGVTAAPVQPYAFQSTPHLRHDARTVSTPQSASHVATDSVSSGSSDNSSAKDDSVIGSRTGSLINLSSVPDLSLIDLTQPVKPSPDRYRRPGQRRTDSKGAATASPVPQVQEEEESSAMSTLPSQRQASVDDMAVRGPTESAKRYRRRSLNNLDTTNILSQGDGQIVAKLQRPQSSGPGSTAAANGVNPVFHRRTNSKDAVERASSTLDTPAETVKPVNTLVGRPDAKGVAVPPRTSSEATKRITAPSPLSQSAAQDSPEASPVKPRSYAAVAKAAVNIPSPAAQQLAAVSDRDLNKGMKSRLRRAFSFGSSQELRRVSAQNASPALVRQNNNDDDDDELDPEQQEIARRQEAAGFGTGIYSGQGGFTGSTDNISISSTASSASLMLRKMGQSARKSARSIKGLFRPKSVIGVPAADGPVQPQPTVQPSAAQVSMVTVEAERHRVNVNAHPAEHTGGGTGFPKLEQNSLDAPFRPSTRGSADGTESAASRRSIVGSDKDRADVLAAVKKGILKRSGTESPVVRTPDTAPHFAENPATSTPGTPKDRIASANGDYFSPRLQVLTHTKSMPATPTGSSRNISFSPRIQFHDAWSATEYDRRGEIATCNRLTPMLAQQIKEELNNFKMEMEVHELSKPHTHFF